MYGRKGYQLIKDFATGEKGQLKPFNVRLQAPTFMTLNLSIYTGY